MNLYIDIEKKEKEELCLYKNNIKFERTLYTENNIDSEKSLTAKYKIN